ncbi:MAG: pyridoxamine kinase [Bacteroidales bacterium]|jgi:pyridoxine kinase|nr:pyridoxamine kinase [Bacteroidales bacterium]
MIKKVAALHDISGYGRSSLTVVIPVLSAMEIYVCPVPTAVLSTSTAYPDPYIVDMTEHIVPILSHWKKMGFKFDAIYSGFLGSSEQCDIVKQMFNDFDHDGLLKIVDPVLGDSGELYSSMPTLMVNSMKELVKCADIITPNLTEACLLLEEEYRNDFTREEIENFIYRLSDFGPKMVVITGVPEFDEKGDQTKTQVFAYSKTDNKMLLLTCDYIPAEFPGTGDTFASVVCGSLLHNNNLFTAVQQAMNYVYESIKLTFEENADPREGVYQEKTMPLLLP